MKVEVKNEIIEGLDHCLDYAREHIGEAEVEGSYEEVVNQILRGYIDHVSMMRSQEREIAELLRRKSIWK